VLPAFLTARCIDVDNDFRTKFGAIGRLEGLSLAGEITTKEQDRIREDVAAAERRWRDKQRNDLLRPLSQPRSTASCVSRSMAPSPRP